MQSITGKLTRPKNYKTPLQRAKEKKIRENAEKERIRQEILQAEPVNDLDLSEFSGYIAQKSSQSKSEIDIAAEKEERKRVMKEKREDAQRQRKEKLKEQQEEATEMKKQEEVQIQAGNMVRMEKKNKIDIANVEDLKALERLQKSKGDNNGQIDSMAEVALSEENDKQQIIQEKQSADEINSFVENAIDTESTSAADTDSDAKKGSASKSTGGRHPKQENVDKVLELSSKLGIKANPSDAFKDSKKEIVYTMVQRAIKSGKSKAEIAKAMA